MDVEQIASDAGLRRDAATALGKWLSEFRWDCFATFTYSDPSPYPHVALDRAQNFVKKVYPKPLAMFLAAERHKLGGIHAHGLIRWQANLNYSEPYYKAVWAKWFHKYGSGRFVRPERTTAAAYYVAKYLTKSDLDWRIWGDPERIV